ncbi:MAG TPA: hypothetical protein PLY97_06985 [Acidocella sp.]|nr:hypothetical protein [Acidocella sp.]
MLGATRGIVSEAIEAAIAELTRIVSHARSKQPLYHVHLDPELPWTAAQYEHYWELFEREFGVEMQPFVEAVHIKHGREHYHRVYSRVRHNGTVIPLKHDYARREKLGRIIEFEFGGRHVPGRHNRTVAAALRREGRLDVVQSMAAAGLLSTARPVADTTPAERHQGERTALDSRAISEVVFAIWQDTATGEAFAAALAQCGLRLAMGDKVPVLVDLAGGTHSLTRMIGKASVAAGVRVKAADVQARITNLTLSLLTQHGDADDDKDRLDDTASLDADDYSQNPARQGSRRAARVKHSRDLAGRYRRPRLQPDGVSDLARAGQYRDAENRIQPTGRPAAQRAQQSREDYLITGGHRKDRREEQQKSGRSRRAYGRDRVADCRVERCLDEVAFAVALARLVSLTAVLDPDEQYRRRWEEGRVERMLDEPAFSAALNDFAGIVVMLLGLALVIARLWRGGGDGVVADHRDGGEPEIPPGQAPAM